MNFITFGSDVELMLAKDDKYYSAIGIVQGDRDHRIEINGHEFFYDNVLAEVSIKHGKTKEEVIKNIKNALKLYKNIVKPYKLIVQAAQEYPEEQLKTDAAREIGCSIEFDAYTLKPIEKPEKIIKYTNLRTAGGHIHLGGGGVLQNSRELIFVIYMLDLFLAIPSILIDKDKTSKKRRTLYGTAGSHREKDYGLEYRALGPFWIESPELVDFVYDMCMFVVNFVEEEKYKKFWELDLETLINSENPSSAYDCFGYDNKALQKAINNCDKKLAEKFMIIVEQNLPVKTIKRMYNLINQNFEGIEQEWEI